MSPTDHHSRGFSLIELMFSMAIGSVILILAATLLGSSGEGYERVGGNVASEREARALITQLAADLSTAKFHKDGVIEKSSAAWPADRIGFLSLQPAAAQSSAGRIGDLCAVNYYLADLAVGGRTVRCLMRGFRESNDTFAALREDKVGMLFEAKGNPDSPNANSDEPVAFGVVSFEVRPKWRDSTGKWIDWVKNDKTGPDAFDVKLVLARRDLAGRLKLPADWNGTGGAGNFLGTPANADRNKDLEIYATTLRFGNHAPL
jgi:prepilin-type N-terminal cleavage/methylation domain-containing protein